MFTFEEKKISMTFERIICVRTELILTSFICLLILMLAMQLKEFGESVLTSNI